VDECVVSASLIGRFGVKRFQTIRRCSVDVAHGLVLLLAGSPQHPGE
jgi:hypothetical protein